MTENAANKLNLSKSWSASASLRDRAQKTAIIVTSKVLQRKHIARDDAHRLLAAKLKAVGQKGTDRSLATWEEQHDDAIISARKRARKNVQVAHHIRDITIPQIINALTTAIYSSGIIQESLNTIPCTLAVLQEESLFVEVAINDAIAVTKDWTVARIVESFEGNLSRLNAYYKTAGTRRLDSTADRRHQPRPL